MEPDPIVEEIHRIRAELLAKFNGNLEALVEDARRRQTMEGRPIFRKNDDTPRQPETVGNATTDH